MPVYLFWKNFPPSTPLLEPPRLFFEEIFQPSPFIRDPFFEKWTIFYVYIAKQHAKMVLFKELFAIFKLSFDFTPFMLRGKLVSLPISRILR